MKIKPYIPVYARPPNRLLRYEERRFVLECGKTGFDRVAIFMTKKGQEEMVAQVVWDVA